MSETVKRPGGRLTMPVLWAAAALLVLLLSLAPLARSGWLTDVSLYDTYYVAAHYHWSLPWLGFCAAFAVVYLVLDLRPRSSYPRPLAWAHIGLTCLGLMFIYSPLLMPQPRRLVDYSENFALWNTFGAIGYALIGLGLCAFAALVVSVLPDGGERPSPTP